MKATQNSKAASELAAVGTGRSRILTRWRAALAGGETRGESKDATTQRFLRRLAESGMRVSRGTLYGWWRRFVAHGVEGLADGRSAPRETPQRPIRPQPIALNLPADMRLNLRLAAGSAIDVKQGPKGLVIDVRSGEQKPMAEGKLKAP